MQKSIIFVVVVLIIFGGIFVFKGKKTVIIDKTPVEIPDNNIIIPDVKKPVNNTPPVVSNNLTKEQQDLLVQLKKTVDARDFGKFADVLLEVYKKEWGNIKEFTTVESELYVYATNEYWIKGDLENSLKISTIVYNKVPEAWRFRYLRIVTLEKYGRNALNASDLVKAENYANQILQMMFRPEGANLLADVYISKINTNIKAGNTNLAKQNLSFIWDYEVSAERREVLSGLKKQLGE